MLRRAIVPALFATICSSACKGGSAPAVSPPGSEGAPEAAAAPGETVVRADDDGKSFDVARGATVIFKLASHAGTGYAWTPTRVDASILAQQGERSSEVTSEAPGAPKFDVYRFTAGVAGSTTVEMSLKRPFGEGAAARAIHVTVNVH